MCARQLIINVPIAQFSIILLYVHVHAPTFSPKLLKGGCHGRHAQFTWFRLRMLHWQLLLLESEKYAIVLPFAFSSTRHKEVPTAI